MTTNGHPNLVAAPVAAAKLFTVCSASFPHSSLPARE
jgi:hypothetical protein